MAAQCRHCSGRGIADRGGATGGTHAAAAVACPSGADSDFNGDGARDTAIADPEADVDGVEKAGVVHVVYGGGSTMPTSNTTGHGEPATPCGRCARLLEHLGIG